MKGQSSLLLLLALCGAGLWTLAPTNANIQHAKGYDSEQNNRLSLNVRNLDVENLQVFPTKATSIESLQLNEIRAETLRRYQMYRQMQASNLYDQNYHHDKLPPASTAPIDNTPLTEENAISRVIPQSSPAQKSETAAPTALPAPVELKNHHINTHDHHTQHSKTQDTTKKTNNTQKTESGALKKAGTPVNVTPALEKTEPLHQHHTAEPSEKKSKSETSNKNHKGDKGPLQPSDHAGHQLSPAQKSQHANHGQHNTSTSRTKDSQPTNHMAHGKSNSHKKASGTQHVVLSGGGHLQASSSNPKPDLINTYDGEPWLGEPKLKDPRGKDWTPPPSKTSLMLRGYGTLASGLATRKQQTEHHVGHGDTTGKATKPNAAAHAGHTMPPPSGVMNESTLEYIEANNVMHRDMNIVFSGDADADFIRGMIPHHQGALDMAKVVLRHGKDKWIRRMAEEVIFAQKEEIAWMRIYLRNKWGKQGDQDPSWKAGDLF